MIVYDIFERPGIRSLHSETRIFFGGEHWLSTVSSAEAAVEHYCRDAVNVVRPREGEASECEDLD